MGLWEVEVSICVFGTVAGPVGLSVVKLGWSGIDRLFGRVGWPVGLREEDMLEDEEEEFKEGNT